MATNDERGIKPFDYRGECGAKMAAMTKAIKFYVDDRVITAAARRKTLLLHCAAGMKVQQIFEP